MSYDMGMECSPGGVPGIANQRQLSLMESLQQKKKFLESELAQLDEALELLEKSPETQALLESLSKVANIHLR